MFIPVCLYDALVRFVMAPELNLDLPVFK